MSGHSGLIVRRNARYEVALPARLRVAAEHQAIVAFGAAAGARDGWVHADVLDFGSGGVGLISEQFVPRGVILDLEIMSLEDQGEEVLLACRVKVMRVVMTDRRPAYLVGTAFSGQSPETIKKIDDLIALLEGGRPERDSEE